ncbi:DUF2073 domain-containing protein [Candidatus Woesearchaeota archaeon]|nr:DUF2073 domain-containing protein [Candidatus Woesearchaeota archaeon]
MSPRKNTIEIQVLSMKELKGLSHVARVHKILNMVKEQRILLLDGNLEPSEEAELIKDTMKQVDRKFPGIEIGVLRIGEKDRTIGTRIREFFEKLLFGHKKGITIIGPANIVREIKQDPDKAILLMELKK